MAAFNGYTFSVLAAASLAHGVYSFFYQPFILSSLIVGAGLAWVAYNEFRGRRMLRERHPRAARFLGWNQVGFMTMIVVYAVWCILYYTFFIDAFLDEVRETTPELSQLESELEGVMTVKELLLLVLYLVYVTLIALTLIFQGLNAWFYFRRHEDLAALHQENPSGP